MRVAKKAEFKPVNVFDFECILPCDVDETLITKINPVDHNKYLSLQYGEELQFFKPCTDNIALLKHHKVTRGYGIIVWSANGKEWAEKVVRALGIEDYVDLIMTKPVKYLDDKPIESWMPSQIWLGVE